MWKNLPTIRWSCPPLRPPRPPAERPWAPRLGLDRQRNARVLRSGPAQGRPSSVGWGGQRPYNPAMAQPNSTPMRALVLLLLWTGLCACPSLPKAEDWLDVGFRSPRQTFHTFRTALADGQQAGLEYRCFSGAFKAREGLSALTYHEFREQLLEDQPLLRTFFSRAAVTQVTVKGKKAVLEAKVAGRALLLELVREDYWEMWDGEELLDDALVPDLGQLLSQEPGKPDLEIRLPAAHITPTEVRLGGEWKINRIDLPNP